MGTVLKRLVLVLIGILFALGALEVAARVLHLGTGGFWEPHPEYGWRNIPGAAGWESCYGECNVYIKINSLGLRDEEIPYEKAEATRRILLLGDSMTAGMQVPLSDTFGKQLEAHLNDTSQDVHWEVINGSVNGFGTDSELLFYRLEGVKYEPDIVLVGMYLANDVYNNSYLLETSTGGQSHKPYFELDENGALELHNYPVPDTRSIYLQLGTFLKKHFQLPRFVAQTMNLRGQVPSWFKPIVMLLNGARGVTRAPDDEKETQETNSDSGTIPPNRAASICDEELTPEINEAWDITSAVIHQLQIEVEDSGAKLAVLVIPAMAQTLPPSEGSSWYCERPNEDLARILAEEGIPYLDLLDGFREHMLSDGAPLYYVRDFHMNENGHYLAGLMLDEFIRANFVGHLQD